MLKKLMISTALTGLRATGGRRARHPHQDRPLAAQVAACGAGSGLDCATGRDHGSRPRRRSSSTRRSQISASI